MADLDAVCSLCLRKSVRLILLECSCGRGKSAIDSKRTLDRPSSQQYDRLCCQLQQVR
jgi:hypothetical protein